MDVKAPHRLSIPKYAFWDTDVEKLDLSKNKITIISRMFETGKWDDLLDIVSYYGKEECIKVLTSNSYLSENGMYLGHVLLSIPLDNFSAYALHQSRR